MAAAATAAVASSFSPSMQRIIYTQPKNWLSDPILKLTPTPMLKVGQLSHSISTELISICGVSHRWQLPRISAAVAQEEAAVTAPAEEEEEVVEEDEKGEEVSAVEEGNEGATLTTKLYFGNLPYGCDSAQLAGIIQEYGSPELVEVLYDRDTGRSRGFAFVTMSSIEECKVVIKNLDGSEYGGRTLRVNFSDKPKPKEPLYPETDHKLFIGNLAWSVTSESLAQAFQEYGNVVGARVLYDGETGRSRGYGFVCYASKSEMESALQSLNGMELEGRAMRVSLAQGKRQ